MKFGKVTNIKVLKYDILATETKFHPIWSWFTKVRAFYSLEIMDKTAIFALAHTACSVTTNGCFLLFHNQSKNVPYLFLIYLGAKILKKDAELTKLWQKPSGGAHQGHHGPPEPGERLHAVRGFLS